jgi:rhodanese-related sulfurtransferase
MDVHGTYRHPEQFTAALLPGRSVGVSPGQVQEWARKGDVFLVDLRSPEEFEEMRIAGSFLGPLSRLVMTAFPITEELKTVFICQNGHQASKVAGDLAEEDAGQIYALDGGLEAWLSAGYDVDD